MNGEELREAEELEWKKGGWEQGRDPVRFFPPEPFFHKLDH